MRIKLVLVDDNALFRDGVARILKADGRFRVVGQAATGAEAVTIVEELSPDLVLMDLRMPGMSGEQAIKQIRARDPKVAIGVLSIFETDEYVSRALEAGANGYLAKDATPEQLCSAVARLAAGEPIDPMANGVAHNDQPASDVLATLTPREFEVLRALASDQTYAAIARDLKISPKTLRNHISNTYHKLRIYDRAQAVILAVQEGVVEVPGSGSGERTTASRPRDAQ
ncbi:MAG TPA: response regulator transcription factor [Candidatus Dormibacteraeota bacterium]|nr:response regulator transcription factor [Candidatus Dormibacteraeota bacterium]